jgi:hypothetical protein
MHLPENTSPIGSSMALSGHAHLASSVASRHRNHCIKGRTVLRRHDTRAAPVSALEEGPASTGYYAFNMQHKWYQKHTVDNLINWYKDNAFVNRVLYCIVLYPGEKKEIRVHLAQMGTSDIRLKLTSDGAAMSLKLPPSSAAEVGSRLCVGIAPCRR